MIQFWKNLPFISRTYANVKAKLIHVKDTRPYIPYDKRQVSNLLFLLTVFHNLSRSPVSHFSPV
jgi:hypothetical protein